MVPSERLPEATATAISSFAKPAEPDRGTPQMTVREYMTLNPVCIGPSDTLAHAHELMRDKNVRHLPVTERHRLVGIVSQRDLHLIETLKSTDPEQVTVDEAMTENPYAVPPDSRVEAVVETLISQKYGSAVVVEKDAVVGIFTRADALRALLELLDGRTSEQPETDPPEESPVPP